MTDLAKHIEVLQDESARIKDLLECDDIYLLDAEGEARCRRVGPAIDAVLAALEQAQRERERAERMWEGVSARAVRAEREVAALKADIEQICRKVDEGTMHRLVCSADHSQPIGGDMCICNPLKAEVAALRRVLGKIERGLEAHRAKIASESLDASRAFGMVLNLIREERSTVCTLCGEWHPVSTHVAPEEER